MTCSVTGDLPLTNEVTILIIHTPFPLEFKRSKATMFESVSISGIADYFCKQTVSTPFLRARSQLMFTKAVTILCVPTSPISFSTTQDLS